MKIELNKFSALSVINAIRHIAMTDIPVLRPIAFAVGEDSNVLDIGDWCEEDMTEFIANVSTMEFAYDGNSSMICFDSLCNGAVPSNTLEECGARILTKKVNEILHLRLQARVRIYFRFSGGKFSRDENIKFLEKQGVQTDELVVISSRHCAASCFLFDEVNETENTKVFDVRVITSCGKSEHEVLSASIDSLVSELKQIEV